MLIRETVDGNNMVAVGCDVPLCWERAKSVRDTGMGAELAVGWAWGANWECKPDGTQALCPEHRGVHGRQLALSGGAKKC